jgi:ERCC4-type nuclease
MEVARFDVSDVHTEDMLIGIERKAGDFVKSMLDGTLNQQLKELVDNFDYPFLFVEYEGIKDLILDNTNINPKSLIGEFTSILARHKVSVIFTGNYDNVPLYVPMVIRTVEKFYDGKNEVKNYSPIRRRKRPAKRDASHQEVKLDIISRIPKVGAHKGVEILEKFNYSIGSIANADVDEIMKIEGVGKILANRIKEVLK